MATSALVQSSFCAAEPLCTQPVLYEVERYDKSLT
jgi:hypothetical protein